MSNKIVYIIRPENHYEEQTRDMYACAEELREILIVDDAFSGISVEETHNPVPHSQGATLEFIKLTCDILFGITATGASVIQAFAAWKQLHPNAKIELVEEKEI